MPITIHDLKRLIGLTGREEDPKLKKASGEGHAKSESGAYRAGD